MSNLKRKVFSILKPYLGFLLDEQKVIDSLEHLSRIILIAEKYMTTSLEGHIKAQLEHLGSSRERYESICRLIVERLKPDFEFRKFEIEFIVGMLYPKLDAHVSAQTNHLLKAPFNVHHDSQKLSVPMIDVKNFDVERCIMLEDLDCSKNINEIKGRSVYSLGDYVKHFEKFVNGLETACKLENREETHEF